MTSAYEVPSWAGKPPPGLHLDIFKDDKFIQKIMIDEKKCYLFGRNPDLNDFRIDHSSCSRVHAALVYHKHLNLTYLVDLGSTHGTFIGNIRLEDQKPTVVHIGSVFHFGASTRYYTLREKPKTTQNIVEDIPMAEQLGLPENEDEVDNLTEYNTAHNRKISTLGINDNFTVKKGSKRKRVAFNEDEMVINPEDIDDSVGKFRNMVQSTVIPVSVKRIKIDETPSFSFPSPSLPHDQKHIYQPIMNQANLNLYSGLPSANESSVIGDQLHRDDTNFINMYSSTILPVLPNPAPEIESTITTLPSTTKIQFKTPQSDHHGEPMDYDEPKRKKYAKEAWPKKAPKHLGDI